ncbi:hypothetical protein LPMP_311020 [Leishmania panamensis]|uniref:Membrane transporter, putative n=3 Tax=Leishmania guyanensis species complex TaxID=38579 RepID=A0A088RZJ8_LEIPA|nr:hypothetical protein LPMP_311020 [Leishmania panamensis]AIO00690.1 hypothetical protein LPMP_311020 [Leishmania panamensis]CCM17873.1 hypothetical protein, conserved [Leishmania guyanensis]
MRPATATVLLRRHGDAFPLLVALALFACLAATPSAALVVAIRAGENFMITEALGARRELHFQFALHPEYLFPVSIKDRGTGEELMRWKDLPHGAFSIPASDKTRIIVFSFDNSNTLFTSKNVNFDIRTSLPADYAIDSSKLDPIEQKIRALSGSMQHLKTLQISIRNQQRDHRLTVENANTQVLWWSFFQVLAFLIMLSLQLYLLKRLLEKKTYM